MRAEPTLRERALAFARGWLSVREVPRGSNRGAHVDEFNREAGVSMGSPWCVSFIYACYLHAALHAHTLTPILRTAGCSILYEWAVQEHRITSSPVLGDIGLLRGGPHGHFHAVLVERVLLLGLIQTIEGNTNPFGSPEGYGVFRRIRRCRTMDFVRSVI